MNTINARRSVKQFIRTYRDELLEGLESNNEPLYIARCTTSRITPQTVSGNGIYIGIVPGQDGARSFFDATQLGTSISYTQATSLPETVIYDIEIHTGMYANIQSGEETGGDYEPFEVDTETFETFTARLVDLFRKYTTIDAETGSYTISVYGDGGENDRLIRAAGESRRTLYWVFYLRLETCGETTPLAR
jgi:hypothetical protein